MTADEFRAAHGRLVRGQPPLLVSPAHAEPLPEEFGSESEDSGGDPSGIDDGSRHYRVQHPEQYRPQHQPPQQQQQQQHLRQPTAARAQHPTQQPTTPGSVYHHAESHHQDWSRQQQSHHHHRQQQQQQQQQSQWAVAPAAVAMMTIPQPHVRDVPSSIAGPGSHAGSEQSSFATALGASHFAPQRRYVKDNTKKKKKKKKKN
jgi:hypothetical protein